MGAGVGGWGVGGFPERLSRNSAQPAFFFFCSLDPLHLTSPIALAFPRAAFWHVLPRTPSCGRHLGRVQVNGACLPSPSSASHTQKASHPHQHPHPASPPAPRPRCTPGPKCLGRGCHGDSSCCLDCSCRPASCLQESARLAAWHSRDSWGGHPPLSPFGFWH